MCKGLIYIYNKRNLNIGRWVYLVIHNNHVSTEEVMVRYNSCEPLGGWVLSVHTNPVSVQRIWPYRRKLHFIHSTKTVIVNPTVCTGTYLRFWLFPPVYIFSFSCILVIIYTGLCVFKDSRVLTHLSTKMCSLKPI